jgi:steroid 5-alpha reductase family enzyme
MPPKQQATRIFIVIMLLLSMSAIWALLWAGMFTRVITVLLTSFSVAAVIFLIAFVVGLRRKRWDGIDVAWGYAGAAIAVTTLFLHEGPVGSLQWAVTLAGVCWGIRLGTMILLRQRESTKQDPRYTKIIASWKSQSNKDVFLRLYVVQAMLITLVSIPIIHINTIYGATFGTLSVIGLMVWVFGFAAEVVSDRQLATFKKLPKSSRPEICNTGLRKYARHPQYFGELVQWWGLAVVSLGTPYGWVGLMGAVLITYVMYYISGVSLAEQRLATKKGWNVYKEQTNLLVPIVLR